MKRRTVQPQLGLTLIELLVTMILLGLVLSMLSGALFQVSKVTQTAQRIGDGLMERWNRSMLPPYWIASARVEPRAEASFWGTETAVEFFASPRLLEALVPKASAPDSVATVHRLVRMRLSLERGDGRDAESLALRSVDGNWRSNSVLSVPAPGVQGFMYRNTRGDSAESWPIERPTAEQARQSTALPSAVGLVMRTEGGDSVIWLPIEAPQRKPEVGADSFFGTR